MPLTAWAVRSVLTWFATGGLSVGTSDTVGP